MSNVDWNFFYAKTLRQGLFESLLYHAVRSDNRHNFSPYFYSLYLRHASWLRFAAFVPIAVLPLRKCFVLPLAHIFGPLLTDSRCCCKQQPVTVLAWKFSARRLCVCLFSTTLVFVAFNKVLYYFCAFVPPFSINSTTTSHTYMLCFDNF